MRILWMGAALGALVAGAAIAQDQGMMPPPGHPGGPPPMMQPLKRADVAATVAQHFAELDANRDGSVTQAEIDAQRAKKREAMRAEMVARIKAHREAAFDRLDANKDGAISKQEFGDGPMGPPPMPPRAEGPGRGPHPGGPDRPVGPGGRARPGGMHAFGAHGFGTMGGRWFDKADANHNGKVTLAEAQAAALAAFDKADVNHDGTIDRDEMMAARMAHRDGRGRKDHGTSGGDMPPPPRPR